MLPTTLELNRSLGALHRLPLPWARYVIAMAHPVEPIS